MSAILEVKNLSKKWKDFKIDNVSFSIEEGYLMGFVGRNGAGKTTIINLIMNAIKKDSGDIYVAGFNNQKEDANAKNEIGFILDNCPFMKEQTLLENAMMFGKLYKNFDILQFENYLVKYGLNRTKKVKELSKGMEIKFQLAFAISKCPKLLIMDEPTGGLDPIFRKEFLGILQELMEEEKLGIMLSTHITSDLDKIADYITLIDKGRILLSESKEELADRYMIIKGGKDVLKLIPSKYLISIKRHSLGFSAMITDIMSINESVREKLNIQRANIEDIMYYLTSKNVIL